MCFVSFVGPWLGIEGQNRISIVDHVTVNQANRKVINLTRWYYSVYEEKGYRTRERELIYMFRYLFMYPPPHSARRGVTGRGLVAFAFCVASPRLAWPALACLRGAQHVLGAR